MLETTVDGGFSNMLVFNGARLGISSDGIGTKIELGERSRIYDTLGFDLVAMVVDDLIAGGFIPTNISNILDVDHLDYDTVDALMRGLHDAANFANISVTGGEIAELGNRIAGYGDEGMHFNWCSTAIGILHPSLEKTIDGTAIQAGDIVMSIKSRGFRSNGFSAIRRVMQQNFGDNWHTQAYDDTQTWGQALLTPSLIFAPLLSKLLDEGFLIRGIAHITGGGIADNFRRILKANNLGAKLDNLFLAHPIMEKLQTLGGISDEKAYLWWNMGNGMLFVLPQDSDVTAVSALAQTLGYAVQKAGVVTNERSISLEQGKVNLTVNY